MRLIEAVAAQRYSVLSTEAPSKTRSRLLSIADLPYPENRLVSPAHSLVARGVIDEAALEAHGGG